jgi:uroporphyrinogen decarboxylase
MKSVIDLVDGVEDRRNLIIAPGCDMPYDVPVENAIGAAQAVWQEADVREILKNYVAQTEDIEITLPDYSRLKIPFIEVFTLDSATCAACSYMMGAANAAAAYFGDAVELVEYKYTVKENIARCKKMGVPNLPSMYINGELKYRSIIPSKEELFAEIKKSIVEIEKIYAETK